MLRLIGLLVVGAALFVCVEPTLSLRDKTLTLRFREPDELAAVAVAAARRIGELVVDEMRESTAEPGEPPPEDLTPDERRELRDLLRERSNE